MVKVKRINPEEDVTLEITAPKRMFEILTNLLGQRGGRGYLTSDLYFKLDKEFPIRDQTDV